VYAVATRALYRDDYPKIVSFTSFTSLHQLEIEQRLLTDNPEELYGWTRALPTVTQRGRAYLIKRLTLMNDAHDTDIITTGIQGGSSKTPSVAW
jgi:hypothetical protein